MTTRPIRRALLSELHNIRRTASAIVGGDLSRRLPTQNAGDELDMLAQTLNRMLDQIENLVHGVRNVSNAIAHDLRTPLAELRSHLEELSLTRPSPEETFAEIEIAVADEGPGIPAADRDAIFERFYRGPSRGEIEGSGLGLAIAKRAVERAGAFDDLPVEREVAVDAAPRPVARQGSQFLAVADPHDARCGRNRHAEKRPGKLEELALPPFAQPGLRRPGKSFVTFIRLRRRGGIRRAVRRRAKGARVNVEPVILLGRQGQQRLPEGALNRAQLLPARLLFLGPALLLDDQGAVGLLARAAIGPIERLLNMLGEQRMCALIYGSAFAINFGACLALIPLFGAAGAATATTVADSTKAMSL